MRVDKCTAGRALFVLSLKADADMVKLFLDSEALVDVNKVKENRDTPLRDAEIMQHTVALADKLSRSCARHKDICNGFDSVEHSKW